MLKSQSCWRMQMQAMQHQFTKELEVFLIGRFIESGFLVQLKSVDYGIMGFLFSWFFLTTSNSLLFSILRLENQPVFSKNYLKGKTYLELSLFFSLKSWRNFQMNSVYFLGVLILNRTPHTFQSRETQRPVHFSVSSSYTPVFIQPLMMNILMNWEQGTHEIEATCT